MLSYIIANSKKLKNMNNKNSLSGLFFILILFFKLFYFNFLISSNIVFLLSVERLEISLKSNMSSSFINGQKNSLVETFKISSTSSNKSIVN